MVVRRQIWKIRKTVPTILSVLSLERTNYIPDILAAYGLTEELLVMIFHQVETGKDHQWQLQGVPTIGFYQQLHSFIRKWCVSHNATKTTIGLLYLSIDPNLKQKGSRADNVYRFIHSLTDKPSSSPMPY